MIKMSIIGNLGKDAEVHMHGSEVCINFSVAHTDRYKDANGTVIQNPTWVSCSWWTDKQVIVQYLKKGQTVFIEGIPEAKLWNDKKTGQPKAFLNMRVLGLQLVGGNRPDGSNQAAPAQQQQSTPQTQEGYVPMEASFSNDDDQLPF